MSRAICAPFAGGNAARATTTRGGGGGTSVVQRCSLDALLPLSALALFIESSPQLHTSAQINIVLTTPNNSNPRSSFYHASGGTEREACGLWCEGLHDLNGAANAGRGLRGRVNA
jgi:hypothetical protein